MSALPPMRRVLPALFEGKRGLFWLCGILALTADLLTKVLLWRPPGAEDRPLVLIPHILQLVSHPGNTKGALGLGPSAPWFYVLAALVVMPLLLYFLLTTPPRNGLAACALGLLAGGAVGNLFDRITLRFVRDFVDLHWDDAFHWHTFNVADAAICVGFALIVLDVFVLHRGGEPSAPERAPQEDAA